MINKNNNKNYQEKTLFNTNINKITKLIKNLINNYPYLFINKIYFNYYIKKFF